MKKFAFLLAIGFLAACQSHNEKEESTPSTIVNADGTVTFVYDNDHAREVLVDVQFAGRNPMARDSVTGLWTATVGPAVPDMYPYCFIVDGVSVMDPKNPQYFPNEGFKNSLLEIPGADAPLLHSIRPVPHGNVDYVSYYSDAIKGYNNAIVYTPPTYEQSDKSYPVFYLISGTTDTEEVYYKVGRMNYILDNLLADGLAQEMIVVLPYGNPAKLANPDSQGMQFDLFSQDLHNDLMPYVESHYRTINDADHRAIGGFSRGGNQGLMNGLKNLDKFSYLCSYSSFTSTDLPDVYDKAADTNSKINLLWAGVGTDDFLYGSARDYTEFLDNKGITCVKEYTTDKFGHTWMNAKYFLGLTMPLLFNPDAAKQAMANAQPTKAKTGNEQEFTPGVIARLFPKPIVSPEIAADNVTFRIKAPGAEEVVLVGEFAEKPIVMQADTTGVWSVAVENLQGDVYCYNFVVDGTDVCDAQNMYLAPDRGFKRSVLDLTEHNDADIDRTPVQYRAEAQADGTNKTYAVVQPKAATHDARKIALVAGRDDTFESWHKIARANLVLDEMLAAGSASPAILILSEAPVADADITINSADYPTWSAARKALIATLQK